MKSHVCEVCGHIYDESATGIPFDQLSDEWYCPNCGADKDCFELKEVDEDELD
jgi:hypothetical protein